MSEAQKQVLHRETHASVGVAILTGIAMLIGARGGLNHDREATEAIAKTEQQTGRPFNFSPLTTLVLSVASASLISGLFYTSIGSVADYAAHEFFDVELGIHFFEALPWAMSAIAATYLLGYWATRPKRV
ncbi:MAG: hypothetical protein AAB955_01565 [Patescibacteria group bacterium]